MIPTCLMPLANHLWQSTLFAAAAGLLTLAFRNNRAPVRYGLWLAASLKFLLPFALLVGIGARLEWRPPAATPTAPVQLSFLMHQIGQPFDASVPVRAPKPEPRRRNPVPAILAGVWFAGFLASLLPWFNRWRLVRTALRTASRVPVDAPIPVMCTSSRLEPGVFGILRPVLLLPDGLTDQLSPAQFEAILAHELCHVRRRDNLAAAVHMVVEALFWFHPLVWWIETRLLEERERACDEEVLRAERDPEVYAEGILNVCKLYLESPLACMSGVTGANLKRRIEAIMTPQATRNLSAVKKLLLGLAAMAAVAVPIIIGAVDLPFARAQSEPQTTIRAEVVSIKRNTEDPRGFLPIHAEPELRGPQPRGAKLTIGGLPLYFIIARAYQVGFQSPRLSGGPEWIRSERYDIEAIAEQGAIPPSLSPVEREARFRLLLQGILADRFKLIMRRDNKEIPVYTALLGKNGPKMKKSQFEEKDCATEDHPDGAPCHTFQGGRGRGLHSKGATVQDMVEFVENWSDRPIINKSGIEGLYEFETTGWLPFGARPPSDPPPPGTTPSAEELALSDPSTPTLFMIFERLGLKLDPQKAAVETYVIDHVERPTGN